MSLPHAILTALLEKPSSGLELTRRFDKSIGYFWSATHQQIYRELGKLETRGLHPGPARRQPARGQKKEYEVLPAGRAELARWTAAARTPSRCATRCCCGCGPPPSSAPTGSRRTCGAISRCTGGSWPSTRRSRSGTSRPAGTPRGPAAPPRAAGGDRPGDLLDPLAGPGGRGGRPAGPDLTGRPPGPGSARGRSGRRPAPVGAGPRIARAVGQRRWGLERRRRNQTAATVPVTTSAAPPATVAVP